MLVVESLLKIDEVKRIKEIISQLSPTGCVSAFGTFMYEMNQADGNRKLEGVEYRFFKKLKERQANLVTDLVYLAYYNKPIEEREATIKDLIYHGYWAISERDSCEIGELLDELPSTPEAYDMIVKAMTEAIDAVVAEDALSLEQREINQKKYEISRAEREIEDCEKRIAKAKEKIQELS